LGFDHEKGEQEMKYAITGSDGDELRSLSDEELQAISGAGGSVKTCDLPRPAPTSGPTAGLLLYPLVYRCN
jgi:hypothetical protein